MSYARLRLLAAVLLVLGLVTALGAIALSYASIRQQEHWNVLHAHVVDVRDQQIHAQTAFNQMVETNSRQAEVVSALSTLRRLTTSAASAAAQLDLENSGLSGITNSILAMEQSAGELRTLTVRGQRMADTVAKTHAVLVEDFETYLDAGGSVPEGDIRAIRFLTLASTVLNQLSSGVDASDAVERVGEYADDLAGFILSASERISDPAAEQALESMTRGLHAVLRDWPSSRTVARETLDAYRRLTSNRDQLNSQLNGLIGEWESAHANYLSNSKQMVGESGLLWLLSGVLFVLGFLVFAKAQHRWALDVGYSKGQERRAFEALIEQIQSIKPGDTESRVDESHTPTRYVASTINQMLDHIATLSRAVSQASADFGGLLERGTQLIDNYHEVKGQLQHSNQQIESSINASQEFQVMVTEETEKAARHIQTFASASKQVVDLASQFETFLTDLTEESRASIATEQRRQGLANSVAEGYDEALRHIEVLYASIINMTLHEFTPESLESLETAASTIKSKMESGRSESHSIVLQSDQVMDDMGRRKKTVHKLGHLVDGMNAAMAEMEPALDSSIVISKTVGSATTDLHSFQREQLKLITEVNQCSVALDEVIRGLSREMRHLSKHQVAMKKATERREAEEVSQ